MPEGRAARVIALVTLPEKSQELIQAGQLTDALDPELFDDGDVRIAMSEVQGLAGRLGDNEQLMLTEGLRHSFGFVEDGEPEPDVHGASVQFLEYTSGYDLEGIGLEIRDDTVDEEGLRGPVRVMFVRWNS